MCAVDLVVGPRLTPVAAAAYVRTIRFIKNLEGHNAVINALAANEDDVLVSCADNGSMNFWDYKTGYCFQKTSTIAQPGSLDAETGVFAASFDLTGR